MIFRQADTSGLSEAVFAENPEYQQMQGCVGDPLVSLNGKRLSYKIDLRDISTSVEKYLLDPDENLFVSVRDMSGDWLGVKSDIVPDVERIRVTPTRLTLSARSFEFHTFDYDGMKTRPQLLVRSESLFLVSALRGWQKIGS